MKTRSSFSLLAMALAALALGMGSGCGGELEPMNDDVSTQEQAMAMFCKPCLEPPCAPCYKYPPLPQPVCGDGWINPINEDCDGSALAGQTCQSLGFAGGTLACSSSCTFDTSGCFYCGDGIVQTGEQCDGSALNNKTCQSEGFSGGTLTCTSSCTFDTSACTTCGDGVVEGSEACDGGSCCRDDCTIDKQCQFLTSIGQALEDYEGSDTGPSYPGGIPSGYTAIQWP